LGVRQAIDDLLAWKIIPSHRDKYVYITAGAVVGGVVFGLSQSWWTAIFWDAATVILCWFLIKISGPLGDIIMNPFRFWRR